MENEKTKQCKKCKEQINKKAKKCPHCGAKQGFPIWLIVIIAIFGIALISNGDDTETTNNDGGNINNDTTETNNNESKPIEYIKVSKDELDDALENNAALAKETYDNKYVEVTGKLGTIDSDLQYISLVSTTNEWDFQGIHCNIKILLKKTLLKH